MNYDDHYSRYYGDYYWWGWPTTVAVGSWFAWDHWYDEPVYYSYGTGGNVYYDENYYYVNNQQVPATEYYTTVNNIAAEGSEVTEEQAANIEWMPLGTFACVTKDVNDTNRYMQLAVSKEGIIGGTYFNEATNSSRPLEGSVDKSSQLAAWTFADGQNIDVIMETGIFNFTKDEVPILIHFGLEKKQEVSLVRVEAPEEAAATEAPAAAPPAAAQPAAQPQGQAPQPSSPAVVPAP